MSSNEKHYLKSKDRKRPLIKKGQHWQGVSAGKFRITLEPIKELVSGQEKNYVMDNEFVSDLSRSIKPKILFHEV